MIRQSATQSSIAQVLAESCDLAEAGPRLIRAIAEESGWALGGLWNVDRANAVLSCTATWHVPGLDDPAIEQFCSDRSFRKGEGLPGRVWESGTAHWVSDLQSDPNFPRALLASRFGLRSGFAFPIKLSNDVLGVFEFYSASPRDADADQMEMMATAGRQIGQAMERWRAEAALKESEERYRIISETAADAIFTIDRHDRILFANPAAEKIFGWKVEELVGQELTAIIPERFRARHLNGIRRFIETGKRNIPWGGVSLPGLHRDGHEIPLELSFGLFQKDDQFYFTGIARDVTERAKAEQDRVQLLESERAARIEALEANNAKDEFLATLSHELRTPMMAILGWARMLSMGELDDETLQTAVDSIQKSAKAQSQLIEDVLDVSRIIAGKLQLELQPIKLQSIVEGAIDMVMPMVEDKALRLERKIDASLPPLIGDPTRLQQVFWNLLGNAIKFTPSGGTIEIALERNTGWAVIRVRDTGEGIDPEFVPHLFERFRQAENSQVRTHRGLGIGLAIVRHLVDLHGGQVEASSEGPGRGSQFEVRLPLKGKMVEVFDRSRVVAREEHIEAGILPSLRGLSVLVVEDDDEARTLIETVLRTCGAEVDSVSSVDAALERIARQRPGVLISDIAMPGKTGHELIEEVRRREATEGWEHLPALALTASAGGNAKKLTLTSGFDDYRRKPIEPVELAQVVARLGRMQANPQSTLTN